MTNTNPNAPAYRWLLLFWVCNVLSVVCSQIADPSITFGSELQLSISVFLLLFTVLQFYPFYRFSRLSDRLRRAFTVNVISAAATILGGLSLVLSFEGYYSVAATALLVVMGLVAVAGAVGLLVSQFWLYAGLDELRAARGYNYPSRLIRLCFFMPLACSIVSLFVSSEWKGSVLLFGQFFCLIILGVFVRAARKSEIA